VPMVYWVPKVGGVPMVRPELIILLHCPLFCSLILMNFAYYSPICIQLFSKYLGLFCLWVEDSDSLRIFRSSLNAC